MYVVLIPLKSTDRGKSRLAVSAEYRSALALAMARDTVAAASATGNVASVLVVGEDQHDATALTGSGVRVLVTAVRGLNPAVSAGLRELTASGWSGPVAVLPADLPFLTPEDLGSALTLAAGRPAAVADAVGTGTTLLVAPSAVELIPHFGADSFRRHLASGAAPIPVPTGSTLHRDVDVVADLTAGDQSSRVGPHTELVLRAGLGSPRAPVSSALNASPGEYAQVTVLP